MKPTRNFIIAIILQAWVIPVGFAQMQMKGMDMKPSVTSVQKGICILYPTQGSSVSGTITFIKVDDGVKVIADIRGLTRGKHGFHIHEFGDCSSPDASSAGGHYNPEMKSHGAPMDMERHMGDMGNLVADESGNAHLEYVDRSISLNGDNSIIGHSVILHKNEDDLKSQPTGNSGPRIACGVIGIAR